MAISVSYYGNKKPAPNVKPQRVINLPDNTPKDKLPFGKANPIDWMTGKRMVQFKKDKGGDGGGSGVRKGSRVGDILYWDGSDWVLSETQGIQEGDLLQWDGSAYRTVKVEQVTCLTSWRLDKMGHVFQVKTRSFYAFSPDETESEWTNITDAHGGILEEVNVVVEEA